MAPWLATERAAIYHGDCLAVLRELPESSINAVVTSPPYAMQRASTYGGISEADYPEWCVTVFEEMRRVLTPDGSILWNISPHVKGGMLADYVLRSRLALRAAGWYEHDELAWIKPDKMPTGRRNWPARSWESVFWYSRTPHPYAHAQRCGRVISDQLRARAASRPAAFQGRDARLGWDHLGKGSGRMSNTHSRAKNFLSVSVRSIPNGAAADHPAPYPLPLAAWLVRMFCPPGGVVLDPFSGSGTTLEAALAEGMRAVGIEAVADYLGMNALAVARGESAAPPLDTFSVEGVSAAARAKRAKVSADDDRERASAALAGRPARA